MRPSQIIPEMVVVRLVMVMVIMIGMVNVMVKVMVNVMVMFENMNMIQGLVPKL